MGTVVNGEYHVSLSQWVWTGDRYGLLDFVSTSTNAVVLALTPQPPKVSVMKFLRAYRGHSITTWTRFQSFFTPTPLT